MSSTAQSCERLLVLHVGHSARTRGEKISRLRSLVLTLDPRNLLTAKLALAHSAMPDRLGPFQALSAGTRRDKKTPPKTKDAVRCDRERLFLPLLSASACSLLLLYRETRREPAPRDDVWCGADPSMNRRWGQQRLRGQEVDFQVALRELGEFPSSPSPSTLSPLPPLTPRSPSLHPPLPASTQPPHDYRSVPRTASSLSFPFDSPLRSTRDLGFLPSPPSCHLSLHLPSITASSPSLPSSS